MGLKKTTFTNQGNTTKSTTQATWKSTLGSQPAPTIKGPNTIKPTTPTVTPKPTSTIASGQNIAINNSAEARVANAMIDRGNLDIGAERKTFSETPNVNVSGIKKPKIVGTPTITTPTTATEPTTPTTPTQAPTQFDTTALDQGVTEGKYTKTASGEYLDAKTGAKVTPTTGTDLLTEANLPTEYKSFYDSLTDTEKKQFLALGEQAQKEGQDIAKGYANYMRDYNTVKTRAEQDREAQLKQEEISKEMGDIQSSQTLRKARQQVDKLIQSVAYLGTQGMPGVSQARLTGVQNQISESERTYGELVRLQQLADSARSAGYADTALRYEREMEDLNTKLNDNIDKSIQEAYNSLVASDQNGQLDTVQEIENFRLKMLNDLDSKITGITDASIAQRQFLIQRYDKIVEEAKTFEANKNTINKEMSKVRGFYVDGNGSPVISATTGTPIQFPPDAPIDPIYDKRNGTVVSFIQDASGNITAKVDKVMDTPTFEAQTLTNYAKLVANGKMNLQDLQELGLPDEMIQKIISESANITPRQEAQKPVEVGGVTYEYNPTTNQYEAQKPVGETTPVDFISKWEGFRDKAYQDVGGVWTIGHGFTSIDGRPVQAGDTITKSESEARLQQEIQNRQNYMNYITVPLNEAQKTALSSFEYNLGSGIWEKDAMPILDAINSGDMEKAGEIMKLYTQANGQYVQGLANRRNEEAKLLTQGGSIATLGQFLKDNQNRGPGYSEEDVKAFDAKIDRFIANGDEKGMALAFRNNLMNDKDFKKEFDDTSVFVNAMDTVQGLINDYENAGKTTNALKGIAEKVARATGMTTDVALAKLQTQMGTTLADYIRSISGTAASDVEVQRLMGNMAQIGNIEELNTAITQQVKLNAQNKIKQLIDNRMYGMPEDLKPKVFGDIYGQTTPTIQAEFDYKQYLPDNIKSTGVGSTSEITTPSGFKYTPTNSLSTDLDEVFN